MPIVHKVLPAGCALLLFAVSQLMRRFGEHDSFLQNFSALSLALSVVAAAVSIGLLITQ